MAPPEARARRCKFARPTVAWCCAGTPNPARVTAQIAATKHALITAGSASVSCDRRSRVARPEEVPEAGPRLTHDPGNRCLGELLLWRHAGRVRSCQGKFMAAF